MTEHAHTVALYLYFKSASKKVDRAGSSKEPESMPSVGPGVSEIATFPPITDKLRLFHLPHSLLPPIRGHSGTISAAPWVLAAHAPSAPCPLSSDPAP